MGVSLPRVLRLVVAEQGRGKDYAIIPHPEMEEKIAKGQRTKKTKEYGKRIRKNAKLKPVVSTKSFHFERTYRV